MLIPRYWGEAHTTALRHGRRVKVVRFGWSDTSSEHAAAHARQRVDEAARAIEAGAVGRLRDRKLTYGGDEGLPIREEIISHHGDAVVTRNTYGALFLNTPNVLFADVDTQLSPPPWLWWGLGLLLGCLVGALGYGWAGPVVAVPGALVGLWGGGVLAGMVTRAAHSLAGGPLAALRKRLALHCSDTQSMRFAIYETPMGLRVMALHSTYDPRAEDTVALLQAVKSDPRFNTMCHKQRCFRARLTAKPWRIGLAAAPGSTAWPFSERLLQARGDWLKQYEVAAAQTAACRYLEDWGSGQPCSAALEVQKLHDELSRARVVGVRLA